MKKYLTIIFIFLLPSITFSQTGNNNNGRSNNNTCCKDGIQFVESTQRGAIIGLQAQWYKYQKSFGDNFVKVGSPIPKIAKVSSNIQMKLLSNSGEVIKLIDVQVSENEISFPKLNLKRGTYLLELSFEGGIYRVRIEQ